MWYYILEKEYKEMGIFFYPNSDTWRNFYPHYVYLETNDGLSEIYYEEYEGKDKEGNKKYKKERLARFD